ncbi:hypothetical protein ACQHIV_21310 [Kribbella sp. GL6]
MKLRLHVHHVHTGGWCAELAKLVATAHLPRLSGAYEPVLAA